MSTNALDFLLNPIDVRRFIDEIWEKKHLLIERGDPHYYDSICSFENFDTLLSSTAIRMDECRVVKDGQILPPTAYAKGSGGFAAVFRDQVIDPCRIFDHYAEGATIILEALDRSVPTLAGYCRNLERLLCHKAQINAYLTPEATQGFPIHHDTHDVFILQIYGSKRWKLYDSAVVLPMQHQSHNRYCPQAKPIEELTLKAGDLLYIPRGRQHEAMAQSESSLHFTLGITVTTWADLLIEAIKLESKKSVSLREALPFGFADSMGDEGYRGKLADLASAFHQSFSESNDLNDWVSMQYRKTVRPVFDRRLSNIELAKTTLRLSSKIRINRNIVTSLDKNQQGIALSILNSYFDFPSDAGDALDFMLGSEDAFTIGDIPGLCAASRLKISKKLVQEGLATIES